MILVTGATGLVGSHLILHLLDQGKSVKAMFRKEEHKKDVNYKKSDLFLKINWVQANILEIPSLETVFQEVEHVYHCAGFISFNPKDENKLRKVNIEGTANVVNFCLDFKIKKLCYISSIATLGDLKTNETQITEESEWNPEMAHSDYAISKYGGEIEVWRGQQEGLNVIVVNPGVILGPIFWTKGSGEIYQKIKNGLPFYTKGSTGFVSVIDVVKITCKLMESTIQGEKFILVSQNKTYQEILFNIADVLNLKRPKYYVNKIVTGFAWRIDWVLSTFFGKNRSISKNMNKSLNATDLYSNKKIVTQIDYKFQDINAYLTSSHENSF
jgi:dihydroflavonol-4-reductase